jgi:hypothetical protein
MADSFRALRYFFPSSELSHSIFAIAISQVSLTVRSESDRYDLRMGMEEEADIAPIASAACGDYSKFLGPDIGDLDIPHAAPWDLVFHPATCSQGLAMRISSSFGLGNRRARASTKLRNL